MKGDGCGRKQFFLVLLTESTHSSNDRRQFRSFILSFSDETKEKDFTKKERNRTIERERLSERERERERNSQRERERERVENRT